MLEHLRHEVYELFTHKGVRIEVSEKVDLLNFCCLKIRYQPAQGMTLVVGRFTDDFLELLLICHEFGHVVHYENLSREDAEVAYCTIFASNYRGLENISPEGKQLVISIEKKASEYAMALLRTLTNEKSILDRARNTYNEWIAGYLRKANLSETYALAS
ncbi:MAG: hypothetical protein H6Q53_1387 [Deltaproteobacteria bacterium]|jgi:hypothetical protein|nr:hypothetical protein [Deltaproteobacteria bacterium]